MAFLWSLRLGSPHLAFGLPPDLSSSKVGVFLAPLFHFHFHLLVLEMWPRVLVYWRHGPVCLTCLLLCLWCLLYQFEFVLVSHFYNHLKRTQCSPTIVTHTLTVTKKHPSNP